MNYRHAFHAGGFADVMKHALVARMLVHLTGKPTPFFVLDTHAGRGLYDLSSDEAARTGEWQGGVGRLDEPLDSAAEALLAPYRAALAAVRSRHGASFYPGSPLIIREFLRPGDRGLAVELHRDDQQALAEALSRSTRIRSLNLDGWTALYANIPPKERRGLILIDPPYEEQDEVARLAREAEQAWRKWPTGLYALWYPIKDAAWPERLAREIAAGDMRKVLRLELMIDSAGDPARLNGCGLIVINPPWTLKEEAEILLPALAGRLARSDRAGWRCDWLIGE